MFSPAGAWIAERYCIQQQATATIYALLKDKMQTARLQADRWIERDR